MTMHKTLHPIDEKDRLYESRKEGGRELTRGCINTRTQNALKKQRQTYYSDQKQHKQHNNQQNNNYSETEMSRKTTVWIL